MTCEMMESLGAFLLGAVDTQEWSRIDGHLAQCDMCRAEVVRLAGLPGLIRRVPIGHSNLAEGPAPSDSTRGEPRPARPRAARLLAGFATVMAIAGIAIGIVVANTGRPAPWSHIALAGTNPTTRAHGQASLTAQRWGTEIWVQLDGVPPGSPCHLVINATDGRSISSGAWSSDGDSRDWMPASVPFTPAQIATIDITLPAGELVRLSGPPPSGGRLARS
jgi:anti-sigma factor RsiW